MNHSSSLSSPIQQSASLMHSEHIFSWLAGESFFSHKTHCLSLIDVSIEIPFLVITSIMKHYSNVYLNTSIMFNKMNKLCILQKKFYNKSLFRYMHLRILVLSNTNSHGQTPFKDYQYTNVCYKARPLLHGMLYHQNWR